MLPSLRSVSSACLLLVLFAGLTLLFGPADLRHAKPERVADDRVIGTRRYNFGLKRRLPMGRWPDSDAVQVTLLLGPSHLIAARRELKDRIDLNGNGLLFGDLE